MINPALNFSAAIAGQKRKTGPEMVKIGPNWQIVVTSWLPFSAFKGPTASLEKIVVTSGYRRSAFKYLLTLFFLKGNQVTKKRGVLLLSTRN